MCFLLHLGSNVLRDGPRRASGTARGRVIFQTGWSFPGGKPGFRPCGHSGADAGSIGVVAPSLDKRPSWYAGNASALDSIPARRRLCGPAGVRVIFQTGWSFSGGKPGFGTCGHSGADGGSIGVAAPSLDKRRSWYAENVSVIDRQHSCTQETAGP